MVIFGQMPHKNAENFDTYLERVASIVQSFINFQAMPILENETSY